MNSKEYFSACLSNGTEKNTIQFESPIKTGARNHYAVKFVVNLTPMQKKRLTIYWEFVSISLLILL